MAWRPSPSRARSSSQPPPRDRYSLYESRSSLRDHPPSPKPRVRAVVPAGPGSALHPHNTRPLAVPSTSRRRVTLEDQQERERKLAHEQRKTEVKRIKAQMEAERIDKARAERDRIERDRERQRSEAERERQRVERDRIEKEQAEREQRIERDRIEKEQAERERQRIERDRIERERVQKEQAERERQRVERAREQERADRYRLEIEKDKRQREQEPQFKKPKVLLISPTIDSQTDQLPSTRSPQGLNNLGNTCFMNSVIQCLAAAGPLSSHFLSRRYEADINVDNPIGTKGRLAQSFAAVMEELWGEPRPRVPSFSTYSTYSYSPYSMGSSYGYSSYGTSYGGSLYSSGVSVDEFRRVVARWGPRFSGYGQHDAQEFLRFVLDSLHEDTNRIKVKPAYKEEGSPRRHLSERERAEAAWRDYQARNDSYIADLFCGQLRSTVTCLTCSHVSITYDPFWDLSVPIPAKRAPAPEPSSSSFFRLLRPTPTYAAIDTPQPSVTLHECLADFAKEETLDGTEQVYCSNCKTHRRVSKRLELYRLPKVCIRPLRQSVHRSWSFIQRDSASQPTLATRSQLQSSIPPADSAWLQCCQTGRQVCHCHAGSTVDTGSTSVYDLFAVSNHSGGLGGGHYTADVAHPVTGRWSRYDDSVVSPLDVSRLSRRSAYLLFYKAR